MTRFPQIQFDTLPTLLPPLVAGLILTLAISPLHAAQTPAAKPAQTATILGYAFDPDGKPVAGATVCLTKNSDSDDETIEPPVLAQATSAANGRFEMKPTAAQIKLDPSDPSAVLEIWIHKPGLAAAHATVVAELVGQPIIVNLHNTTGTPIRVLRSDRSPCKDATVTPTHASVSDGDWFAIPKPIKDRLKVRTGADGRANLPNFGGQNQVVSIEKPGFGLQQLTVVGQRPCPLPVILQPTRPFKGQLHLPKGAAADLSRIKLQLYAWRKEMHRRTRCPHGKADAHWWVEQTASVNRDGEFTFPNALGHGFGYIGLCLPPGMRFVEKQPLRPRFAVSLGNSGRGTDVVLHVRIPVRAFSVVTLDTELRFDRVLPWTLALAKAAWTAGNAASLHVDIELEKGIHLARLFRNSETKQPLAGVVVYFRTTNTANARDQLHHFASQFTWIMRVPLEGLSYAHASATAVDWLYWNALAPREMSAHGETSADGLSPVRLVPGRDYEMAWEPPQGFVGARSYRYESFHVPVHADSYTLASVELTPLRHIDGQLVDAAGKPLSNGRVLAVNQSNPPNANQSRSKEASRWTITDSAGHFHYGSIAAGTKVTLVAVRHGVPLDERTVAAGDSPATLGEKSQVLTALSGRVLGPDRQPIRGAQIAVEVENSPDATQFFQTTADQLGRFETPAEFPKQLKYRLVVRSVLKSVATSAWICPATAGNHFPDVLVEPAKLGLDKKIPGSEAIALVDGRPILASEIVERAYPEPLRPDGLSLLAADKGIKAGNVTEADYRSLQIAAFKKYAADYARTRMAARACEAAFDEGARSFRVTADRAIDKMFDEYVEKLERDLGVTSRAEVDEKLHRQGTSLASLKPEFRYRILADEYIRQAGQTRGVPVDRPHLLSYYRDHRASFGVRATVCWQMLEIEFDNSSQQPRQGIEQASAEDTKPWTQPPKARGFDLDGSVLNKPLNSVDTNWGYKSSQSAEGASAAEKPKEDDAVDLLKFAEEARAHASQKQARDRLAEARALLKNGVAFDVVAKKFSAGSTAERGGWQTPVDPEAIADKTTADVLRKLPEGQISAVIETGHSFRVIRVATRTPVGWWPFEEVEGWIKQELASDAQREALEDLYSRTTAESPYIDKLICRKFGRREPKSQQTDAFSE